MANPETSTSYNTARTKDIVDRLDDVSQIYDQLKEGREFVAAERFANVSDGTQAADIFIGNDAGSDVDLIFTTTVLTGGATQITAKDNASVETAGTNMPIQNKGVPDGRPETVEYNGTYTGENPITWIIPGSSKTGGPSGAVGGAAQEVRLLEPGEGFEYTFTNESGNTVDYGVKIGIVEIPI